MIIHHIALTTKNFNKIGAPSFAVLQSVAHAIDTQLRRDVAPEWGTATTVQAYQSLTAAPPGSWPVYIEPTIDDPQAEGYHTDANGQPYAVVKMDPGWTITASHEIIEMAIDPFGNKMTPMRLTFQFPATGRIDYRANVLVEACDPCEGFTYRINGVEVSDFVTPDWYHLTSPHHTGDFLLSVTQGDLGRDGYVSFIDLASNEWLQVTNFNNNLQVANLGSASREREPLELSPTPMKTLPTLRASSDRNIRTAFSPRALRTQMGGV